MTAAALLALALALAAAPAAAGPPPPEPVLALPRPAPGGPAVDVVPGGLVRWPCEGLVRCGDARETWAPVGGACLYPVDLGQEEGTLAVFREGRHGAEAATLRVLPPPYAEENLEVDPRKVKLSAKDRARADREREQVVPLFSLRTHPVFSLPFSAPLEHAPPARNFGTRRVFNGEPRNAHGGADFRAAVGTPVLAAEEGLVVLAASHFFAGKSVYVDHGGGLLTMYMHLSRIDVKQGQRVARGDVVGLSGATGRVTGPHLHFGVKWRGARVDPSLLLGDPARLPSP
jgi:murein DD-endopeptidase MepM/ murein hydrolase activator NlpD